MQLTRQQIKANRLHWAHFLQHPARKKATGVLERRQDRSRCCLGHACAAFDFERKEINGVVYFRGGDTDNSSSALATPELVHHLGMVSERGDFIDTTSYEMGGDKEVYTLVGLNDTTSCSPQEIGMWLEDCVEGGPGTPFIHLDQYPEAV